MDTKNTHSHNILNNDADVKGNEFIAINPRTGKPFFDCALFSDFLELNNFYRYEGLTIKLYENIATPHKEQDVYNFGLDYIKSLNNPAFRNTYIKEAGKLINSKTFLGGLQPLELKPYRDSIHEVAFFLKNLFVVITKDGFKTYTYDQLSKIIGNRFIFNSRILKRNFDPKNIDHKQSQYYQIIELASENKDSLLKILTSIGYLSQDYKNEGLAKMPILTDIASITTNAANGRSCKGLILKGLEEISSTVLIDGKTADFYNPHVLQSVTTDTRIIIISDLAKDFKKDGLFNLITDSMTIKKLYQPETITPFKDSPKVVCTTNYSNILSNENSWKARIHPVILNNYFNIDYTPLKHFNNLLFTNWDNDQWNLFYATIFEAARLFLLHGLADYESETLKKTLIEKSTSKRFLELMETEYSMLNSYYNLKDIAAKVKDIKVDDVKAKSKICSEWINKYAIFKGYKVDKRLQNGVTKLSFVLK
ncbi:MAG: hypothetical protein KBT58_12280 [Bizionia sp.]|nr:hypothetical protein [Bizionia sp.]